MFTGRIVSDAATDKAIERDEYRVKRLRRCAVRTVFCFHNQRTRSYTCAIMLD